MGDLRNVLNGLKGISSTEGLPAADSAVIVDTQEADADKSAEDVGDLLSWHLGIVDKNDDSKYYVSYMKKTDKRGKNWLFPEEAEIRSTQFDHIIARNIPIKYSFTAIMRCTLDNETHSNIEECFQKVL